MKKAILVSNRRAKNQQGGNCLWLTMYELPRQFKAKDGTSGLWYPKKDDALLITCIEQVSRPDDYNRLLNVREGAVCLIHFAVNDFTNKTFISQVDIAEGSNVHSADLLYKNE